MDFSFLKQITSDQNTPEFGGFNTKLCREQGRSIQPATRAIYTPLIDMDPADPDTMFTAMEGKRLTAECGQTVTIFTNDQQLYRVAVNVKWVYPERFTQAVNPNNPNGLGMWMHLLTMSSLKPLCSWLFAMVARKEATCLMFTKRCGL